MGEPHLWAQITSLAFSGVYLLVAANRHGKTRTEKGNFWTSLTAAVVSMTIGLFAGTYSLIF